jgi:hypothetical protein
MNEAPVSLAIERRDLAAVEGMLLRAKAAELAELRRLQTQLSIYGERRASMASEPAAIATRLEILTELLRQIEAQR